MTTWTITLDSTVRRRACASATPGPLEPGTRLTGPHLLLDHPDHVRHALDPLQVRDLEGNAEVLLQSVHELHDGQRVRRVIVPRRVRPDVVPPDLEGARHDVGDLSLDLRHDRAPRVDSMPRNSQRRRSCVMTSA